MEPLLQVENLSVSYRVSRGVWKKVVREVRAVSDVSLEIAPGETLGVVGESGCGKSTLARTIIRLIRPDAGRILFGGRDLAQLEGIELKQVRRELQMVFQDPYSSLNPRMRVVDCVGEGLVLHRLVSSRSEKRERVAELLKAVGLLPEYMDRFPAQFSGGQRQRIGIARALAVNPRLLICDEPVSALDVSVQAQIVALLEDLRESRGISMLFIGHDLAVVRHISHRIAVMYFGKIVEMGPSKNVIERPMHPYTKALLAAVPSLEGRKLKVVRGENVNNRGELREALPGHWVRCERLEGETPQFATGDELG